MSEDGNRRMLEISARVCTDRQHEAIVLKAQGAGYKRISLLLGITPDSARDLVERASLAIERAEKAEQATTIGDERER